MDLIIRNVNVEGNLVDIAIHQGKIVKVGTKLEQFGTQEIEGNGRVAIPGFADCHLHLDKSLLNERASYQDVSGPEKGALTREEKVKFTVDDIKNRAERVIKKGIQSGNIVLRTNVDVDPLVGLKGIEALLALKEKYAEIITIQIAAFAQEGISKYPETVELLDEAMKIGADLVGGHTIVDADGEKHIDTILDIAKKYDVEADFHLDESGKREHYLLPYLSKRIGEEGLQGRVNGIHLCTLNALSQDELKQAITYIQESKLKVTIAPTAISTRAIAPVKEILAAGIITGLGSDNVRDFFNPLGSGDVKHVALLLSYLQRFFTDDDINNIWDMITVKGAEILGYERYGIRVGNFADITVLDAKTPKEVLADQAGAWEIIRKGNIICGKSLSSS